MSDYVIFHNIIRNAKIINFLKYMQNYSLQVSKCNEVMVVKKYYSTSSAASTPLITTVDSDDVNPDDVMPTLPIHFQIKFC